jgi:AcrR family transcriptional regulator
VTASETRERRAAAETLTRREKQQQTRQQLLRAAAEVFGERGLEGASIDEVAQKAGYTKGAFYANFKSKEELFLVMLDERFAEELERLDGLLTGTHEPQEEALAAAADFIQFATDDEWQRLSFQFLAHAARNEEFRQELATRQQAMRQRMAKVFARWKQGFGINPAIPVEDITAMTVFMSDGFLVGRIIEPGLSEDLYTTMIGVFVRGLQAMADEQ